MSIADQLRTLRTITANTGVLHEAQKFQLAKWGPLVLQNAKDIEVAVNLQGPYVVEFNATGLLDKNVPENLDLMLEGLDRSVKWLLGDHFTTRVSVDGSVIFENKGSFKQKANLKDVIKRLQAQDAEKRADEGQREGDASKPGAE